SEVGSEALDLSSFAGKGLAVRGRGFLLESLRVNEDEWHRELDRVDVSTGAIEFAARLPEPPPYGEPGRIQRGRVLWTALEGQIVAMWSDRARVEVYDGTGGVVREIRLPMTRRTLTERDIQQQVEHYGGIARTLEPGTAALTNELYTVNDTVFGMFTSELWKSAEDPPLPVGAIWWRLFSVRGEYLGVVQLPEDFRPLGRSESGLWARVLDDTGYPLIQELELVRREMDGNPST
ncbi:MAG: hypothetical protein GY953_38955, partial [bacterium]|nr:hypothetical protein [bacterium]